MLGLVVESWVWYSVAIVILICRFISRSILLKSVKNLQVDDWMMLFAAATYTTLIVCMNIVADLSSNLLPPEFDINTLTPDDVRHREYGSKMVLVVEQMQCITIWTLKATLLIMYYRLTIALKQNIIVKVLAVYTAVGFVVMEILYLGVWCRPFHNYWAVPTPNIQCSAATHHLITNAVLNISSDLVMLGIGISMFIKSSLPLRRKLVLYCIFGLGIFVILSAVLNKYYSFTQPFGSEWTFWYTREASTAFIIANVPFTWTLLRRVFNLKSFHLDESDNRRQIPFHSARSARGRPSYRHSDSQNSQTEREWPTIEQRESRGSSRVFDDLDNMERATSTFGPLDSPKHPRKDSRPSGLTLMIHPWEPEADSPDYGSPVSLPGRAFYYEDRREPRYGTSPPN